MRKKLNYVILVIQKVSKKLLIDCGEGWKWIHFFDFIYHLQKYLKALPESPSSLHWPPATTSCTGWYNITSVPLLSQLDFIKSQHDLRSFRGRCFFPGHHPKFGISHSVVVMLLAGGPGITDYLLVITYRSFSSTHWLPNIHGSCFITYHAGWWVLLLLSHILLCTISSASTMSTWFECVSPIKLCTNRSVCGTPLIWATVHLCYLPLQTCTVPQKVVLQFIFPFFCSCSCCSSFIDCFNCKI